MATRSDPRHWLDRFTGNSPPEQAKVRSRAELQRRQRLDER